MELRNKIAVITGSTSGLGKALADLLVKEGAKVVVNGRNAVEANKVATEIDAIPVIADVANEKEVGALAQKIVDRFGRIDIWINNAGIWLPHGPAEDLDMERVRRMVDVNLFGTMNGSIAALRVMRKQNEGIIVNILSTSALSGRAGSSAYCASKYGATGFTKSIQLEVKGSGIKVIAVYPGGMQTHLFDEKRPDDLNAYMQPSSVAEKIIANLKKSEPEDEMIIKRSI